MTQQSVNVAEYVVTEEDVKYYTAADDSEQLEQLRAGLMPFQLVKYFSFSSLGVILLFTLFLSWAISNNAKNVMLDQSEAYSLLLAENLNQRIIRDFVLPTVVNYGNIALSNPDRSSVLATNSGQVKGWRTTSRWFSAGGLNFRSVAAAEFCSRVLISSDTACMTRTLFSPRASLAA